MKCPSRVRNTPQLCRSSEGRQQGRYSRCPPRKCPECPIDCRGHGESEMAQTQGTPWFKAYSGSPELPRRSARLRRFFEHRSQEANDCKEAWPARVKIRLAGAPSTKCSIAGRGHELLRIGLAGAALARVSSISASGPRESVLRRAT
mgnify:CR=1 FL=1